MVRFLNCFEIPAGQDDAFFDLWRQVNAYMAAQPGYLGHRLHRSLSDDARFRFVNYAEWQSAEAWRGAHDDGFRALVTAPEWKPYKTVPALYEVVHEGGGSVS